MILIADYNPQWPHIYEAERQRILGATGQWLASIEHVGSTSVPGLAAKPIIDIMAGIRTLADAPACIAPLEALGYHYVPEYEASIPERRYFRKGPKGARLFHLHMVEPTSDFWEKELLFRDYLRAHPSTAQAYEALKRKLARQYTDGNEYCEAKTDFIMATLARAYAERATP